MAKRIAFLAALILVAGIFQTSTLWADQVGVRFTEGLLHGFVALRTLDGKTLAVGDLTQVAEGEHVTMKLSLSFKDGSVHEETTVFSQHDKFQVIKYHIVQKGPAFKNPLDTTVDASTGQITGHYRDDDGKERRPPRWGGCRSQKLSLRELNGRRALCRIKIQGTTWLGS